MPALLPSPPPATLLCSVAKQRHSLALISPLCLPTATATATASTSLCRSDSTAHASLNTSHVVSLIAAGTDARHRSTS
eukprot:4661112-Pleurochrysis_carterae.AAC.1